MIRVGVLGCGRIGRMHVRNIARHPRLHLATVFDVVPAASAALAEALGVTAAASAEAVIADASLQAVLIATPTETHVALLEAAARAGKAVLCEKPIDLDMGRVDACWTAIEPLAPVVLIGFNRRFDPSFRAVRDRILEGEIGTLEQVVITSRDPAPPPAHYVAGSGGLFHDMTIHDFDMARYLVGEIAEVSALGANLIDPAIGAAGDIDAAMITLRAVSGALVHINNSRRCAYGYDQRLEAFGSEGMLQVDNRAATTVAAWTHRRTGARDRVLDFFIERYADAYIAELDNLADMVEGKAPPLASFADGVAALRLADASRESLRTSAVVKMQTQ